MATRRRYTKRQPTPVSEEAIKDLLAGDADPAPEAPEEPRTFTIFDQIGDLSASIKAISDQLRIPVGSVIQIANIALNYNIAIKQLQSQQPFPTIQAVEPESEAPPQE